MPYWTRAIPLLLSARLLCAAPSLTRLPLTFEPALRPSEFVATIGGPRIRLTPDQVSVGSARLKLLNARRHATALPEQLLPGYTNYLVDSNPRNWRTHVPNYARVRYHNIYPGIDVVYYANGRELEFDFIVAPGADPRRIQLSLSSPDLQLRLPRVYQNDRAIPGRAIRHGNRIAFELAAYDHSRPLVIDPVLSYAAMFGGGGPDDGRAIAVDSTGAAYVVGNAFNGNFPLVNGVPGPVPGPGNSFIAKLNPTGDALVFSTYLAASAGGPSGYAVDSSGAVYLTSSGGGPAPPVLGPAPLKDCNSNRGPDIYVAKIAPGGASLVYSECLGSSGPDYPAAIAVDRSGNAYVTGFTQAADFPLLNPLQTAHPDTQFFFEGFLFKLKPDGALAYSTFLGGGMGDNPRAIAVDPAGNVYITGTSSSPNFPLKNPLQSQRPSPNSQTGFIVKIKSDGSDFVYSTFFGGSTGDSPSVIAADASGNTYVAGGTVSADFPTTKNALQTRFQGVFVSKSTDSGRSWVQSDAGLPAAPLLSLDPANPRTLYAVSANRLFKSSDAAATWRPTGATSLDRLWVSPGSMLYASSGQHLLRSRDGGVTFDMLNTSAGSVNTLVFDPTNPSIIYGRWGGTGGGDGVFKTVDGGDTWKPTGLTGMSTGSGGLAVDPARPSTLYAIARARGLIQSDDGGDTWTTLDKTNMSNQILVDSASRLYTFSVSTISVSKGDVTVKKTAPGQIAQLVIDPNDLSTWYAGIYLPQPPPVGPPFPGPAFGIYKTTDAGDTWERVGNGLPTSSSVTSLLLDPNSPGTLYIGSYPGPDGFFSKLSPDGSALQYSTYLGGSGSDMVRAITVDSSGNTYLAGDTNSSAFPLKDPFRTSGAGFVAKFDAANSLVWSSYLGGASPNAIAIAPSGDVYLTGNSSSAAFPTRNALQGFISGDLFRTTDAGATWTGSTILPNFGPPIASIAVDPQTPSRVFVLGDRVYVSNDSGQSWTPLGTPGFSNKLIINPQNPEIMYASGYSGLWKSTDGGATWVQVPIVPTTSVNPGFPVLAFGIDPRTPSTLYAGLLAPPSALPPDSVGAANVIYKSTDAGATWARTGSPTFPNAIVVDPADSAVVYGAFSVSSPTPNPTGVVSKSTDGGATWTPIMTGLPSDWLATALVPDPNTPGRLFAIGTFQTHDLFRTDDGGSHWIAIGSGLPSSFQVTALAIDPAKPSLVYAASAAGGLYRSTDAGATWTVVPGMKIPIVSAIAIDPSNASRIYTSTQPNTQDAFVMRIVQ